MSKDLISKKTRYEFREYLVNWVLREIEMEFDAADIACDSDYVPELSGARRSFVEQYYHSLDFSRWEDVKRLLVVYENILNQIVDHSPEIFRQLIKWLEKDGFVFKNGRLKPASGTPRTLAMKSIANEFDAEFLSRQIARIEEAVNSDPSLALGTAKELIETCCKTILRERGQSCPKNADIPQLVKVTLKELKLVPEDIEDKAKGASIIKRLLSNLASISHGLAELRNLYGSGHGKDGKFKGVKPRHAQLAAGAAITLTTFLFETHRDSRSKEGDDNVVT